MEHKYKTVIDKSIIVTSYATVEPLWLAPLSFGNSTERIKSVVHGREYNAGTL